MRLYEFFAATPRFAPALTAALLVAACSSSAVPIGDQYDTLGGATSKAGSTAKGGVNAQAGSNSARGGGSSSVGGSVVNDGGSSNAGGVGSSSGGTPSTGGSSAVGGAVDCGCVRGAYVPVCGNNGTTYDAACGDSCVPVPIACRNTCPCSFGAGGRSGTVGSPNVAGSTGNVAGAAGATCTRNGSSYALGAQVPMGDGCNTCVCSGSSASTYWACTTAACPNGGTAGSTSTGGAKATGGSNSAGQAGSATGALCGGKSCSSAEVCCGPMECGTCIPANTTVSCPVSCSASSCGPSGAACSTNQICLERRVSFGPTETTSSSCVTNPCGTQTLDCSCGSSICPTANPSTNCSQAYPSQGTLVCVGGGVCASPDTPIATPDGNVPIADLKPGDVVYSSDDAALVAVPLIRVTRRAVSHHFVVHLRTSRGSELTISAPHPTADGRTFGDLKVGDSLDGDTIVARALVPYPFGYTYDILPASPSGTYVANGLLIGSTLAERSSISTCVGARR